MSLTWHVPSVVNAAQKVAHPEELSMPTTAKGKHLSCLTIQLRPRTHRTLEEFEQLRADLAPSDEMREVRHGA